LAGWLDQMDSLGQWTGDWAWGVPLIVLNVVLHVSGLTAVRSVVLSGKDGSQLSRVVSSSFTMTTGVATLLTTVLHGIEASIWAAAYRLLGALPDMKSAMLYSLSAITTYGHANIFLKPHWQLMGAMEALNGMLLFGLTTAFLFAVFQRVWQSEW
jgi:hypothetical protein